MKSKEESTPTPTGSIEERAEAAYPIETWGEFSGTTSDYKEYCFRQNEKRTIFISGASSVGSQDVVGFAEWACDRSNYVGDGKWDGENDDTYTTQQLYTLYLQNKK